MFFVKDKRIGWYCDKYFKQIRLLGLWISYSPENRLKQNVWTVWWNHTRLV